jgi:hypothetical protein
MSTHVWTPGAAGPLDEFIGRLERIVTAFMRDNELEQAEVRIELADGSRFVVVSTSAEPGFGFFSFTPYRDAGEEPRRVIVPIGAVRSIDISAPDTEHPLGFVPAS